MALLKRTTTSDRLELAATQNDLDSSSTSPSKMMSLSPSKEEMLEHPTQLDVSFGGQGSVDESDHDSQVGPWN